MNYKEVYEVGKHLQSANSRLLSDNPNLDLIVGDVNNAIGICEKWTDEDLRSLKDQIGGDIFPIRDGLKRKLSKDKQDYLKKTDEFIKKVYEVDTILD